MKRSFGFFNILFFIVSVLLIFVAGFRPLEYFRDTAVYLETINSVDLAVQMEPTVWIINNLNKIYFGGLNQGFFLIYAILGVSIKVYAIKKISPFPFLSLYLYVCLYYVLHELTQIRVGVACGFFLLSLPDLFNRNYKAYFIKIFFAVLFHFSALIMILFYFVRVDRINKKLFFMLPIFGIVLSFFSDFILYFLNSTYFLMPGQIGFKLETYLNLIDNKDFNNINVFNFFMLSLIFLYYFWFFNLNVYRSGLDILLFKLLGLQIFIFYTLSVIPTLAFRISEFIGICLLISIPKIILLFKDKIFLYLFFILWGGFYLWFVGFKIILI